MSKFQEAIPFILKWEGGYINDKSDPGGETNYGITKSSYPTVDIRNLTVAGAMEIYKRDYWDAHNLDSVPTPMCVALFDSYVNMRPEVVKQLQEQSGGDWAKFIQLRKDRYGSIAKHNPTLVKFLKGWLNRANDLSKFCQCLAQKQQ